MHTPSLLALVTATLAALAQAANTYGAPQCQTSGGSPSATDLNNMGVAMQQEPQASKNYCSGNAFQPDCEEAATWNTAAVNICSTYANFCILGRELGHQVQQLAISCRNGGNLSGGIIHATGSDGLTATIEAFHS